MNTSKLIIFLLCIILVLLSLQICIFKKKENFEDKSKSSSSDEMFAKTHEFSEYSKNSDKLLDMWNSLEFIEEKCDALADKQRYKEEVETMRQNDMIFNELTEQDKKIQELKEIIKYLSIEKKRRDKINNKCRLNKQRKLNTNYDIVKKLNKDGLARDNTLNLDLNISNSDALKALLKGNKGGVASDYKKCRSKGSNYVNLDKADLSKCYGCDSNKLKTNESYILKDFK